MVAGQKSVGLNGLENFLFPLPYMFITQGEDPSGAGGVLSHRGSYAIDFQGYGETGRIYNAPYYAPFTCRCARVNSDSSVWWQSVNDVNFINGTSGPATIVFVHDDNYADNRVGDIKNQGDLIGHTGTAGNVTGDHVHIETAHGHQTSYYLNQWGVYCVTGSSSMYNNSGVDNTQLVRPTFPVGGPYLWRDFGDVPPPVQRKRADKYPWFIHNQRLYRKRIG